MPKQYPSELRERAVRLVAEHRGEHETEYAAIRSIAAKLGIARPETLRQWIRKAEVDAGQQLSGLRHRGLGTKTVLLAVAATVIALFCRWHAAPCTRG